MQLSSESVMEVLFMIRFNILSGTIFLLLTIWLPSCAMQKNALQPLFPEVVQQQPPRSLEDDIKRKLAICKALLLGYDFPGYCPTFVRQIGGPRVCETERQKIDERYTLVYDYCKGACESQRVIDNNIAITNMNITFCPHMPYLEQLADEKLSVIAEVYDRLVKRNLSFAYGYQCVTNDEGQCVRVVHLLDESRVAHVLPQCDGLAAKQVLYLYDLLTLHDQAIEKDYAWWYYKNRLNKLKTSDINIALRQRSVQWQNLLNDITKDEFWRRPEGLVRLAADVDSWSKICNLDHGIRCKDMQIDHVKQYFNDEWFAVLDDKWQEKIIYEMKKSLFFWHQDKVKITRMSQWYGKKYVLKDNNGRSISVHSFKNVLFWQVHKVLSCLAWIPLIRNCV